MPTIEYRFLYHGPSSGQICSDLTFRDEKRLEAGEGLWHREEEQLIYTEVTAVRRGEWCCGGAMRLSVASTKKAVIDSMN